MPSKMPRLVPTQMIDRRSLLADANAGYVSSGGGSSDGGFMIAGVESRIVPNGCLRTLSIRFCASVRLVRFMSDISAAAFAFVNAIIVPSAVVVNRLRLSVDSDEHTP